MASAQGAHGFRAQSRWAPRVGAFINLESTGPGGPDFVFQARLQILRPTTTCTPPQTGQFGIRPQLVLSSLHCCLTACILEGRRSTCSGPVCVLLLPAHSTHKLRKQLHSIGASSHVLSCSI